MNKKLFNKVYRKMFVPLLLLAGILFFIFNFFISGADAAQCNRTITADVVAIDQSIFFNRLGAVNPNGMIYALREDVVNKSTGLSEAEGGILSAGNVKLRSDKRPRPLVLRMNVGDCLQINFQNLLAPAAAGEQPATREVSIHVNGMQLVSSIGDDGSKVGKNSSSLVSPGGSRSYRFYAERENGYLLYSMGAAVGGEGNGGSMSFGLFGAVNVQPAGAEWYRSQATNDDLQLATTGHTEDGQPIINYDAVYPNGHKFSGKPILKMLDDSNHIVHSDINAIITGPNRGYFSPGTYPPNPTYPNRDQPYREFTVIFHDEIFAVQAFPVFTDPAFEFTLQGVRDGFAINYGTGGAGSEVLANRFGLGPMADCADCKYEEFFLTSWAVGDPAMVVDIPANASDPGAGIKATKALYPDDPSNVHHSYLNDHVKFRNIHAGPKEHHIFHLHAHQWLYTPDDDNSTYLDSEAIGPGASFTYEIAYNGSGNRNKTVGDSIFHCHLYPHFAQGMWELWRVHDTFEEGTELVVDPLDNLPMPAPNSRALPDGEILAGTPIPAVIPIPTNAMAPVPADVHIEYGQIVHDDLSKNPGYPFFVPGVAGHRPPTPPLDIVDDGGLPRHVIVAHNTPENVVQSQTTLDFSKELIKGEALYLPETGTAEELVAMDFHAEHFHSSFKPDGSPASFETNGLPPAPGAPYADGCRSDNGEATGNPRIYKGVGIQFDMVLNKAGWHFPQSRILTLWDDAEETVDGMRPPEPFVMRGNTNDCITYYHTNLIPGVYEQDDFQIRTPTDVIGQHIHLVKFDVTSADGSGNGFNYEDGTLSPDEVRERIRAIRKSNECIGEESGDPRDGEVGEDGVTVACPVPEEHPRFGATFNGRDIRGARTTVQRWFLDPVVNNQGKDRQLGNVYTHDHYGPSTHQQTGLYATLIVEPQGSTWRNPETGVTYGSRASDGGPTNTRADILTADPKDSHREFYFEFSDFQLAYTADGKPVNPPGRVEVGLPYLFEPPVNCPNGDTAPCPEAISLDDVGTFSVNYRNEPLALRVRDPLTNSQASGPAGDLSYAFSSKILRADPDLNTQPNIYVYGKGAGLPLSADMGDNDPFTPLLRVYENDKVVIRAQVGATEEGHNITIHGVGWLQEPESPNSGYRNSQMMGISEQFSIKTPVIADKGQFGDTADYLYAVDASTDGYWNGIWGIMRSYGKHRDDLLPLPNNENPIGSVPVKYPSPAKIRLYDITAVTAENALPGGKLTYNPRTTSVGSGSGPLIDPTAILFVYTSDLDSSGKLKAGVPVEPLIIRANAGDTINLILRNKLPEELPDLDGYDTLPMIVNHFNKNQVAPSNEIGLHPQLIEYDITRYDGANIGRNPTQTIPPGGVKNYRWYAGKVDYDPASGKLVGTPVEFGATNLMPSDRIKQAGKGAVGALIIEPRNSTWTLDKGTRASATIKKPDGTSFREFVFVQQTDLNLRFGNGDPVPHIFATEDPEESGNVSFNYKAEPIWFRLGIDPLTSLDLTHSFNFANAFANASGGGKDPVTPLFTAKAGTSVRFRLLEPSGHPRNSVFTLHGHAWEREPYTNNSTVIGHNPLSNVIGAQDGHGPSDHFDIVPLNGAGGAFKIPGDYLYRDEASFSTNQGLWGIFRVTR